MLKFLFLSLASLLFFSCSSGVKRPHYYQVKKGGKVRAHVLGTIHFGVSSHELPDRVHEDLLSSSDVYFEHYFGSEPKVSQIEPATLIYRGDPKIRDLLTPKELKVVRKVFSEQRDDLFYQKTPYGLFRDLLKKVAVFKDDSSVVLDFEYALQDAALAIKESMDYQLIRKAERNKIRINVLDKRNFCQRDIFMLKQAPYLVPLRLLAADKETHEDFQETDWTEIHEEANQVALKLVDLYRHDGLKNVEQVFEKEEQQNIELNYRCLLEDRNKKWASFLDQFLPVGEQKFIFVGVGHLLPSKKYSSFLDELRKRNYQIQRVEFQ